MNSTLHPQFSTFFCYGAKLPSLCCDTLCYSRIKSRKIGRFLHIYSFAFALAFTFPLSSMPSQAGNFCAGYAHGTHCKAATHRTMPSSHRVQAILSTDRAAQAIMPTVQQRMLMKDTSIGKAWAATDNARG
jgi:hypothetical protein